jgi:hypothetical protein
MLAAWNKGVARSLQPERLPLVVDMGERLQGSE